MDNQQPETTIPQAVPVIPTSYNPMKDSVIEKPYSTIAYDVTQEQIGTRIPEPVFSRQSIGKENPYDMLSGDKSSGGGNTNSGGGGKPIGATINPAMNNLPDKDKAMAAEHLAKLIQAGEFIKEFNEQNKDTLSVSKEFKKEILPPLTRVLEKHGAGVTDEQMVGYLFVKDIGIKAVLVGQMRSTMSDMIAVITEYTAAIKSGQATPTPQGTSEPKPQPQQPRAKQEREAPYVNDFGNEFNFENNEAVMHSFVEQQMVPNSGKDRVIKQKEKERKWAVEAGKAEKNTYEKALEEKKNKKKTPKDYLIPMDEDQIAVAIILNESLNQPSKKVDTQIEGLD